jgi:2-C-methyl-D-erythritol 4-phosphate cytidylyltransferase
MSQRPATQATLSVTFVPGGERRQASVRRALAAAPASELVVIHDVARPLASPDLFRRVIDAARGDGAATAAVPARDTVRLVPNGDGGRTLQRTQVRLVQTPQAFRREILERAHETAAAEGWQADDDAELVERLGLPVALVEGEERNLKITTRADLLVAEVLLSEDGRSMRVL